MSDGESAFWQFSLRYYRRPEVPPLCLVLQDRHGVDINVLFFVLYLAINGRALSDDEVRRIDAHVSAWRDRVVQPLRGIRRAMKGGIPPIHAKGAQALRDAIKRHELQAEYLQQEALEREFPLPSIGTPVAPREAAVVSLAACNAAWGELPQATIDILLALLSKEFSL